MVEASSKTIAVVCARLSVTCLLPPLTAIRFLGGYYDHEIGN